LIAFGLIIEHSRYKKRNKSKFVVENQEEHGYNKLNKLKSFLEFILVTQSQLFTETLDLYAEKGSKFTMDELAARLCISKKTLYEMVRSKQELAVKVIEFYFEGVAKIQQAIHADQTLSSVDKLKKLLCATPELPIRKYHLHEMRMSFPEAYELLDNRLRYGWDQTLALVDQAKAEGSVRAIDNQLFSKLYAAAIEDVLSENEIKDDEVFRRKQAEIVDLLLYGICTR
jgi:AcrR family transcriptional regulator